MPVIGTSYGPYPSIEDVFNLARVHLDDAQAGATGTLGEGRIFIDTWTPILTILNEAIADYQRDLSDGGVDRMKKEVFILNLPPVNGPLGNSVPDPSVQTYLSYAGYWDGSTLWSGLVLPNDLYQPVKIGMRMSNTFTTFGTLPEATDGLESVIQDQTLGEWEWRGDSIFFNGAVVPNDIRLRYEASIVFFPSNTPPSSFKTTTIQLLDSLSALAYRCAYIFTASTTGPQAAADFLAQYNQEILKVINKQTRQRQGAYALRKPFGNEGAQGFGWNPQ